MLPVAATAALMFCFVGLKYREHIPSLQALDFHGTLKQKEVPRLQILEDEIALQEVLHNETAPHVDATYTSIIPKQIWQTFLAPDGTDAHVESEPEVFELLWTWIARNPHYKHRLVDFAWANQYVDDKFGRNSVTGKVYRQLKNYAMKGDLLRYMLLLTEGGTYTDLDTEALQPIDQWIPARLREQVRVVIGFEYDSLGGPQWNGVHKDLQLAQWTMTAAPGHPIFGALVKTAVAKLQALSLDMRMPLSKIQPGVWDVLNSTGPPMFTDVVFPFLQKEDPGLQHLTDLSGLNKPTLYGDILVLPIDAFGTAQDHSGATNDGTIPDDAFSMHHFHGSWLPWDMRRSLTRVGDDKYCQGHRLQRSWRRQNQPRGLSEDLHPDLSGRQAFWNDPYLTPRAPQYSRSEVEPRHPQYGRSEVEPRHPQYGRSEVEPRHPQYGRSEVEPRHPQYGRMEVEPRHPQYGRMG